MDERSAEVRRLLDRYIVEIVETYELCPWAKPARLGGELAVAILWGQPAVADWVRAAQALLHPGVREVTRVAMVVAPELADSRHELRAIRNAVAARMSGTGVAEFHPDAELDLQSPPRLVPFLRRSPDPLLQLVPLALLGSVRGAPPVSDLAAQAIILGGHAPRPRGDVADQLARVNHARVATDQAAIASRFADIAADRQRSYARVGIAINTSR